MQLFYNAHISETTETFSFDKEESRHITKVLRKKNGDVLQITNGKGWVFNAKVIDNTLKKCTVKIESYSFTPSKSYQLHLAVAPTKMNDRFEWFLEKATEIGVDSITPIFCEHSERKSVKKERFEKIILSAMKQSLQYYLPVLNDAIDFKEYLDNSFSGQLFIAHCEESVKYSLKNELQPHTSVTLLIGPEGDFSVKEIEMALHQKFNPVTLGETRLRTETAALVACQNVAFVNQ